jgi:hypothetical protein
MKKSIVVLCAVLLSLAGFSAIPGVKLVVTNEGTVKCQKISLGVKNAHIILENGEKSIIPVEHINSYIAEGKQFDNLELYKDGKSANKMVFMELVKSRGDLSLYKYEAHDYDSYTPSDTYSTFYVYRGGKLYLEITDKSLPNVFQFFDVKFRYA